MKFITKSTSIEKANNEIINKWGSCDQDPYRPLYHPIAPHGWLNDPNGLIYKEGWYHVFYQWNPYGSEWGNMHWGHMRSKDLHRWEHLSTALAPVEAFERDGCFSGSAIEKDGKMYLFYTSNIFEEGDHPFNDGPLAIQTQTVAVSRDDVHFEKLMNKPAIHTPPEGGTVVDFRDPKVWYEDGHYHMVLGSRQENLGELVVYTSDNLVDWAYKKQIEISNGTLGYMWECPDIIRIENHELMIFSPMGCSRYQGRNVAGYLVNGKTGYNQDTFKFLDVLPYVYAPQTFAGLTENLLIAWLPMPNLDAKKSGWNGCLTLPRKLSLIDETLVQKPILPENAYGMELFNRRNLCIDGELLIAKSNSVNVKLIIDGKESGSFVITLKGNQDGCSGVELIFNRDVCQMTMDLSKVKEANNRSTDQLYHHFDYSDIESDEIVLDIYLDQSVVEVFAFNGQAVMTVAVFSNPADNIISLRSEVENESIKHVKAREMNPSEHILNLEG